MEYSTKIFVDGIREDVMEIHLRNYFSRFGSIKDVTIIRDDTEVVSYGFITFDLYKTADKILAVNNHIVNGSNLRIQKVFTDVLDEPAPAISIATAPAAPVASTTAKNLCHVRSKEPTLELSLPNYSIASSSFSLIGPIRTEKRDISITPYSRVKHSPQKVKINSNNVPNENSFKFHKSMKRSNSSPILQLKRQLKPLDIGVNIPKVNIQPQTSTSVLKNDMNVLNKSAYEQKISSLKHLLPELETLYRGKNGKSNETDMMRLEELISVIKGQKRISLSYLNELSLKVNHQTDLNFWHKETRIQETTSKIIINGLNEKITENELRVHFGVFGQIVELVLIKNVGFITFSNENTVDEILLNKNHTLNGTELKIGKVIMSDFIASQAKPAAQRTPKKLMISDEETSCPICLDSVNEIKSKNKKVMSSTCGHMVCSDCVNQLFTTRVKKINQIECSECKKKLKRKDFISIYFM